jgi:hypothetical protein
MRRNRRLGAWIAVKVDMLPAQCPGFLSADPGQQTQHDVGVHELGGPTNVLQAWIQLQYGKGLGSRDDRHGFFESEGL